MAYRAFPDLLGIAADGGHHLVGAVHGGGPVGDGGENNVEGDEIHFGCC